MRESENEEESTFISTTPIKKRKHINDIIYDLDQALDKSSKGNLKAVS